MELIRAIKAINSGWDLGISGDSMDKSGNIYATYYVIGDATQSDYKAIAEYTGLLCGFYTLYKKIGMIPKKRGTVCQ